MARRGWSVIAGALLVLTGCAVDSTGPDDPAPEFRVLAGETELTVPAYTYCLPGFCADGMPPSDPPTVDGATAVLIEPPRSDWTLEVTYRDVREPCDDEHPGRLTPVADGRWRLEPVGTTGAYDVTLSARKDREGDAFARLRWITSAATTAASASGSQPQETEPACE